MERNMKFRMEVETGNNAFEEDGEELAKILREVAHNIQTNGISSTGNTLQDTNGNTVGFYTIKNCRSVENKTKKYTELARGGK